jgi:Dyp-type peroxidase family
MQSELLNARKRLQNGIFYRRDPFPSSSDNINGVKNDCFAIIFIRISDRLKSSNVVECLESLWQMYLNLEKGIVNDLPGQLVPSGGLSVMLGYGPKIFKIPGIIKKIPRDFKDKQFLEAVAGGAILEGSGIKYGCDLPKNLGLTEDLLVQVISRSQLATYRAVVETWKYLGKIQPSRRVLSLTTFFTGFQRDDDRSWLSFHDEVSNMRSPNERKGAIVIDRMNNNLLHRDYWTAGGTYLAFLRTEVNLVTWEKINRSVQETIVGRDKLTGVPLIGIGRNGNPLTRRWCPSSLEIQSYQKRFHDHPDYFRKPLATQEMKSMVDMNESLRSLSQSHIGRTRHIDNIKSKDPVSRRIFRQGFEFIEPLYHDITKVLRVGLNFISFQNDPTRLLFILTDPNWLGNSNFGGTEGIEGMEDFLTVLASGIFFVPPTEKPFPGISIFK